MATGWFGPFHRLPAFAVAAIATTGCVKDHPDVPKRTVVANWSFPPSKPKAEVRVWPIETTSPDRKKHGVTTNAEGPALSAKVDGRDPYLMWDFEEEVTASSVRVALQMPVAGPLELFWSSPKCPVFSQDCSQIAELPAGASTATYFLDARQRTRGIRIDMPEAPGAVIAFESIDVSTAPELDAPWIGGAGEVTLESAQNGLTVTAASADPWIIAKTPGLVAERVTALELTMPEAPPDTELPRLFWDGACGAGFVEQCAKAIPRAESKGITHRVELGAADKWTGALRALRVDPGGSAGTYVIRRISLVRGTPP